MIYLLHYLSLFIEKVMKAYEHDHIHTYCLIYCLTFRLWIALKLSMHFHNNCVSYWKYFMARIMPDINVLSYQDQLRQVK
jgi:hypothetical protein